MYRCDAVDVMEIAWFLSNNAIFGGVRHRKVML